MLLHQDNDLPHQKKVVVDETSPVTEQSASLILSPELKDKAMSNRLTAKMKLTSTQTRGLVEDLGVTWFTALEAEFAKPYFQQVLV